MFRTMEYNHGKTTKNNGVSVSIEDGPTYYDKLAHIIEVRYYDGSRYVLFKCDWMNIKTRRRALLILCSYYLPRYPKYIMLQIKET
jgi:hypothetical protein